MADRYVKTTVFIGGYDGGVPVRSFEAGTRESDVPEEYRGLINDHVWTDSPPQLGEEASRNQGQKVAELQNALAQRESELSELRKHVESLEKENEELAAKVEGGGSNSPDETAGELTESKLKTLKKEELLALAAERGVEVEEGSTNPQIIAALLA